MIIFGPVYRTRNIEATIARPCETCSASQIFSLERIRTWFTLFSVPVIPYSTQYWLVCAECRSGVRLTLEEYNELTSEIAASETRHAYMTLSRT